VPARLCWLATRDGGAHPMKPRYLTVFSAVVAGAMLVAVHAQAGKPTYPAYNVTSTIASADSSGGPLLLQSDTGEPYTAIDNIASFVGGGTGEYELDLSQQTTRKVNLDFNVLTGTPNIWSWSGSYEATIFSRCYSDSSGNSLVSLLTLPKGASYNYCSLRINFSYNGGSYSFVMAPPAELPSSAPMTSLALVKCNGVASDNNCSNWTITPNGTSADLIESTRRGSVVVGSYSGDTFQINLQRQ